MRNMIPEAVFEIQDMLTSSATPPATKAKLIENGLIFVEFDKQAFIDSAKEVLKTLEGKEFAAGVLDKLQELDK